MTTPNCYSRTAKSIIGAIAFIMFTALPPTNAQPASAGPLEKHMSKILTSENEQWRTPNPDYEEGGSAPMEYALTFVLAPEKSHVTGALSGVYADGREAIYFSLLAMYNPVTQKIITQQIGWNGLYLYGENPVQLGETQNIDMFEYSPSGSVSYGRHQVTFIGDSVHESDAYRLDDNGEWALSAEWTWVRRSIE